MKRVAAYCRVSTEQDDQLNSLESQKSFFEQYINNNLEWQFVGLYVDEGISGTNVNKRAGFKQMIQDAESRKFDLLLTKEISRFARNTLDSIFYTRKLKELGIGVLFMNDNINTLDPDAELRLTIMSSIAQEESRKTSDRVKWGQKRQMEKGVVFGNGIYGYYLQDGKLTVNPEQAKIVQLIFSLYLDKGMGTHQLCKELENRGIPSPSGAIRWKNASILRMLKNEKYMGTLKQKKEVTLNYLSHKKIINDGHEEYVIIENNHEPIIDKETFLKVQQEIVNRRTTTQDKRRHSNRHVWSGKIECAYCKSRYKRKIWHGKTTPVIVWQCSEYDKYGKPHQNEQGHNVGCDCKALHEIMLENGFLFILNFLVDNKREVIGELQQAIKDTLNETDDYNQQLKQIEAEILRLNTKKTKLIEIFTDGAINRSEFDSMNNSYNVRIEKLKNEQLHYEEENQKHLDLTARLDTINQAINGIMKLEVFSEEICKQMVKKVIAEGRKTLSFFLSKTNGNDIFLPPLR